MFAKGNRNKETEQFLSVFHTHRCIQQTWICSELTAEVTDLMEFDSFHWILPHTALRHSEQHKQAKINCPLCLFTGSNISYSVFPAFFFLFKYSKLFLSLCSLIFYLSPNSFTISHSSFLSFAYFSPFLSFAYSSSTLSFFPGSLVPAQNSPCFWE